MLNGELKLICKALCSNDSPEQGSTNQNNNFFSNLGPIGTGRLSDRAVRGSLTPEGHGDDDEGILEKNCDQCRESLLQLEQRCLEKLYSHDFFWN